MCILFDTSGWMTCLPLRPRSTSLRDLSTEAAFEPPHVHVWIGNEDLCHIELNGGTYMDEPPPGRWREILNAYQKHAVVIRREWDRIHER